MGIIRGMRYALYTAKYMHVPMIYVAFYIYIIIKYFIQKWEKNKAR